MSLSLSVVLSADVSCLVQANSGCPGDAALCRHGDNAEVQLREAPAACSSCSNRGNNLQFLFVL